MAAHAKILRLQAAISVLGDADVVEKENLAKALQRAQAQAVVPPVSEQIISTQGFIDRERKKLAAAEALTRLSRIETRVSKHWLRERSASKSCSRRRKALLGAVRSLLKAGTSRCHARYGLRATRVGEASQPGPQLFRRSRTRCGTRRQVVVLSSDDEPAVPIRHVVAGVQATQNDPESTQMIPLTVPATPVSLAQVGREFLTVPTDVVDALEHDLASRVVDTQLDAPSFVHATQFDDVQSV